MNINKTSLIYKYLDEGIFEAPIFVPSNLCPYMRWFVWNVTREFAVGFTFVLVVQSILWSPIYFILGMRLDDKLGYIEVCAAIGLVFWLAAFIVGFGWLVCQASAKVKQHVSRAIAGMNGKINANIFYRWYKAVHDKVCPTLTFVDKS